MKSKVLIFDFDGVILNSHLVKTQAFKEVFTNHGVKIAERSMKYHLKHVGKSRYIKFSYIIKKYLKSKSIRIKDLDNSFDAYCEKKISKLKISKYLEKFLKRNYFKNYFFVSTGTPQKKIEGILKEKKLIKYFKKIYGSPKTKIQHIKSIINSFDKKKIVFIGDSEEDYKSAKKSNINFVLKVNSENKKLSKKKRLNKIYSFKNFEKYLDYIYCENVQKRN